MKSWKTLGVIGLVTAGLLGAGASAPAQAVTTNQDASYSVDHDSTLDTVNVHTTILSNTSVRVDWSAPTNPDKAVQSYALEYSVATKRGDTTTETFDSFDSSSTPYYVVLPATSTSYTFTGLTAGGTYYFAPFAFSTPATPGKYSMDNLLGMFQDPNHACDYQTNISGGKSLTCYEADNGASVSTPTTLAEGVPDAAQTAMLPDMIVLNNGYVCHPTYTATIYYSGISESPAYVTHYADRMTVSILRNGKPYKSYSTTQHVQDWSYNGQQNFTVSPDATYRASVTYTSVIGTSVPLYSKNFTVKKVDCSISKPNVKVRGIGGTSARVAWSKPALHDGGKLVLAIASIYRMSGNHATLIRASSFKASALSYTIHGLSHHVRYGISIMLMNENGGKVTSSRVYFTTHR